MPWGFLFFLGSFALLFFFSAGDFDFDLIHFQYCVVVKSLRQLRSALFYFLRAILICIVAKIDDLHMVYYLVQNQSLPFGKRQVPDALKESSRRLVQERIWSRVWYFDGVKDNLQDKQGQNYQVEEKDEKRGGLISFNTFQGSFLAQFTLIIGTDEFQLLFFDISCHYQIGFAIIYFILVFVTGHSDHVFVLNCVLTGFICHTKFTFFVDMLSKIAKLIHLYDIGVLHPN